VGLFGPKRIGLALGSGSARGIAHVGVLKALAKAGISPDIVTGTSMGAVVGSLYAACRTPAELERIALDYDIRELISLADVSLRRGPVLNGEKIEEFLRAHLPADFSDLCLPFACVSTDLVTSGRVVHRDGDLVTAVRASLSIPVVFKPVRDGDRLLVDGFLTDPVPVELARELGAQIVVAVDVSGCGRVDPSLQSEDVGLVREVRSALRGDGPHPRGTSRLDLAVASIETLERGLASRSLAEADVVISPGVHEYAAFEFLSAERLIELGEKAGAAASSEIRRKARVR
jgi:predicted acylesterase/phospholipase RssA